MSSELLVSVIELAEIKCLLNILTILTLSVIYLWFTFKAFVRPVDLFYPIKDFVNFQIDKDVMLSLIRLR